MRRRHAGIIGVYYAWIQGRAGSDGNIAEFDGRTRWWRFMHAHACRNNCNFELDGAGHSLNIVENLDKVCPASSLTEDRYRSTLSATKTERQPPAERRQNPGM